MHKLIILSILLSTIQIKLTAQVDDNSKEKSRINKEILISQIKRYFSNKKPVYILYNNVVASLGIYDSLNIKSSVFIQPKIALLKYGKYAKNGVMRLYTIQMIQ